jgi:hypothetical protein
VDFSNLAMPVQSKAFMNLGNSKIASAFEGEKHSAAAS